ncbi:MAG: hypothetical protein ABIW82_17595 [Dokdonella sp.]
MKMRVGIGSKRTFLSEVVRLANAEPQPIEPTSTADASSSLREIPRLSKVASPGKRRFRQYRLSRCVDDDAIESAATMRRLGRSLTIAAAPARVGRHAAGELRYLVANRAAANRCSRIDINVARW